MSEFIWLVIPVKIERVQDDKGMPSAVMCEHPYYSYEAAQAWADARAVYIDGHADVALVYSWDVVGGLKLHGSVGRQRALTSIDFPGTTDYCDNFNREVAVMAAARHTVKAAMEAT